MTSLDIKRAVYDGFRHVYPTFQMEVVGAGTEMIVVDVWTDFACDNSVTWECEIPSDDDGFFRFTHGDLELKIPYPEAA